MTSLDSTSSHLSARMSNPQGGRLGSNGAQAQQQQQHKPASSSSSSSASIFDAFAPMPAAGSGAPGSGAGGGSSNAALANGHRKSSSINTISVPGAASSNGANNATTAQLKSPVVGGPSSTSPSATSTFDALASQFANASIGGPGGHAGTSSGSRHPSDVPAGAAHEYPGSMMPSYPGPQGYQQQQGYPRQPGPYAQQPHHPRSASHQQHHNPNPAVSTMWPRRHGVVKFFNSTKGFGFIWDNAPNEIGDVDIFIHWTTIQGNAQFKTLAEGEMVEYELGRGPKGFQALNVTGPNGVNVQGDPLARLPVSLARSRMMPPGRFNPMGMPMPVGPMMMHGYPQPPMPGQAIDHGYASNPYLAAGRYVPHPHPAAYYSMPGGPGASGLSSGSTTTSHTPISSFGGSGTPASGNSLRGLNGAGGPGSEASAATSVTQHGPSSQTSASHQYHPSQQQQHQYQQQHSAASAGQNSAYAQYLAAANAHQRKYSGSSHGQGLNGYDAGAHSGFSDGPAAIGSPAMSFGAPGGGRGASSRPGNSAPGQHHADGDFAGSADNKPGDTLGIFAGTTPPANWRN